ncbi:DUF2489 domain-containing protein [Microbulbifer agarilyticus]|uniref:DUF2489 domain-containing protein n=1 Tax=Microbulbifer agarilyticus TaxID=260552 RepID=UPI001C94985A|nr:DUF2489 domain-containing protein [Microbulbifer agarilyticus]MBY6189454.1 DUF2489 domain-containing protein [Microbulbifer agarilyticus]MCA0891941.1 DUF2489 domain-containing protein [Microbulbifer agarilyticus]MCA0901007.1 DUF2489 domain-containing protein [Microbulbifer agarilyticus]
MTEVPVWILVIAGLIILVLSAIATYYVLELRAARKRQAQQLAELEAAAEAQRERVNNSIQIIAKTLLEDGVGLTEASIRIRVLLDSLQVDGSVKEEFVAFYQISDKTNHIPILAEWKKLSPKERFAYEKEMFKVEQELGDFALDAAKRILGRNF